MYDKWEDERLQIGGGRIPLPEIEAFVKEEFRMADSIKVYATNVVGGKAQKNGW